MSNYTHDDQDQRPYMLYQRLHAQPVPYQMHMYLGSQQIPQQYAYQLLPSLPPGMSQAYLMSPPPPNMVPMQDPLSFQQVYEQAPNYILLQQAQAQAPYAHMQQAMLNPLVPQMPSPLPMSVPQMYQPKMAGVAQSQMYAHAQAPMKGMYRMLPVGLDYIEQLRDALPVPPLANAPTRPEPTPFNSHRRTRRRSKFSKSQDDMIVRLKKEGRPWVEIADIVGVGSYLAARNRYQVIVGQQGNNNSLSWTAEGRAHLQLLLDPAELEKWRYIAQELSKSTGKDYTAEECREYVRHLFWQNPAAMGVTEEALIEIQKERHITRRLLLQPMKEDT